MEAWARVQLPWGGNLRFRAPGGASSGSASGCRLWASAVTLCGAVLTNLPKVHEQCVASACHVIELGAGVGLPSLCAAVHIGCADVLPTDSDEDVLRVLRGNIARLQDASQLAEARRQQTHLPSCVDKTGGSCCNNLGCNIVMDPERLDFTDPAQVGALIRQWRLGDQVEDMDLASSGGFSLVLASDCCYVPGAADQLVEAIVVLLAPAGIAFIADRDRPLAGPPLRSQLRAAAERQGLCVQEHDACVHFELGLEATRIPRDLITGCVDQRSFVLRCSRVASFNPPMPPSHAISLDELD